MGSQDDLGLAESFVERHQTNTPLMTWDESFATWAHYEVRGQPTIILLDPSGEQLGMWFGLTSEMVDIVENY